MDPTNRSWKKDEIENTFSRTDTDHILRIPLAREEHEDQVVWFGEALGEFSTRSAYKLLQQSTLSPSAYAIQQPTKEFYKKLWNLELLDIIKIIVWMFFWNFFSNLVNLHHKKLVQVTWCPRCNSEPETTPHVFYRCPVSKEVLSDLQLPWVLI